MLAVRLYLWVGCAPDLSFLNCQPKKGGGGLTALFALGKGDTLNSFCFADFSRALAFSVYFQEMKCIVFPPIILLKNIYLVS
jgi:hypothetical protein